MSAAQRIAGRATVSLGFAGKQAFLIFSLSFVFNNFLGSFRAWGFSDLLVADRCERTRTLGETTSIRSVPASIDELVCQKPWSLNSEYTPWFGVAREKVICL